MERFEKNIHSSSAYNSPKQETMQTAINRRMDTQIVISSYNGILFSNEKEQATHASNNVDESQKHYVDPKEPAQKTT